MNIFEAAEVKRMLAEDKNNMVIVPSPIAAVLLRDVYGIPSERIGILACVWAAHGFGSDPDGKGVYLRMTKRQFKYWERRERKLLAQIEEEGGVAETEKL